MRGVLFLSDQKGFNASEFYDMSTDGSNCAKGCERLL